VDPLSIGTLGGEALRLGIQFLYAQAGELLKRRRERGEEEGLTETVQITEAEREALEDRPEALTVHFDSLDGLEGEIRELWSALSVYAAGIEPIEPSDRRLLEVAGALRLALERVYERPLTFQGEQRQEGATVEAYASVDELAGELENVRARNLVGGRIRSVTNVRSVKQGGIVRGVVLGDVGDTTDP